MSDGFKGLKRIAGKSEKTTCALCGAQLGFVAHTVQTGEIICTNCFTYFKLQKGIFVSSRQYSLMDIRLTILNEPPVYSTGSEAKEGSPTKTFLHKHSMLLAQYCNACGRQNPPEGSFCLGCGVELNPASSTRMVEFRASPWLVLLLAFITSIPFAIVAFMAGLLMTLTVFLAFLGIPLVFLAILFPVVFPPLFALGFCRTVSLIGTCPWCQSSTRTYPQKTGAEPEGITCPVCLKRIVVRGNRFIRV